MSADRSDLLRKVRGLLDKADHQNTSEVEAAAFRAKADELMVKFAIEEFELDASGQKTMSVPEVREFEYGDTGDYEFDRALAKLFRSVAMAAGVKMGDYFWHNARVVGYPQDLDYCDMLFTGLRMHMARKIRPQWDDNLPEGENLAMMKEAGMKWQDIWALQHPDQPWERRHGVRYTSVYRKFCEATNRDRMLSNPESWKLSFIEAYEQRIADRFYELRVARNEAAAGHELVMVGREDRLKEALYEFFPDLRPHPANCECDQCHYMKCMNPKCTRPRCQAGRALVKASRGGSRNTRRTDWAAQEAGRRAANEADLGLTGVDNKKEALS